MPESVLHGLLCGNIELQTLLNWLKHKPQKSVSAEEWQCSCTPGDFAIHYLNYVRNQTARYFTEDTLLKKGQFPKSYSKTDKGRATDFFTSNDKPRAVNVRLSKRDLLKLFPRKLEASLDTKQEVDIESIKPKPYNQKPKDFPSLGHPNSNTRIRRNVPPHGQTETNQFHHRKNKKAPNKRPFAPSDLNLGCFMAGPSVSLSNQKERKYQNKHIPIKGSNSRKHPHSKPADVVKSENLMYMECAGQEDKTESQNKSNRKECSVFNEERVICPVEKREHSASINASVLTPRSLKDQSEILPTYTVEPDDTLVDHSEILDKLVMIYCCLFETNLIPNLSAELCFLFSLLVVQDTKDISKLSLEESATEGLNLPYSPNCLLHSIHNCIYFSTNILNRQRKLLAHLDYLTLKLLTENARLLKFHPTLWEFITELQTKRNEAGFLDQYIPSFGGPLTNVSFICEVDSRFNFPSNDSFRFFSKQRDLFYEILRLWEDNHSMESWSFSAALGTKIKELLNKHHEPANSVHLARLFRCQLLMSCVGFPNAEEDMFYNQTADLLQVLASESPDKFARLHDRFKRQTQPVVQSRPEFPGHQEFFRSFLVTANNAIFLAHLKDSLASEVRALNATTFMALGTDDKATFVDDETRHNYLRCIASLRILAKFLAFVTFLPYYTNTQLTEQIASTHLQQRNQLPIPPDVLHCVTQAVDTGTLILTIPWVVQYVALIDSISLRLPYYQILMERLFSVYSNIGAHVSTGSSIILSFCLGWLFEFNIFPSGLYFSWHSDQYALNTKPQICLPDFLSASSSCLDSLEMINSSVLYIICPHLHELKTILACRLSSNNPGVRHITPISHKKPISDEEAQAKSEASQLLEMKEGFFRNQPDSVRKVVSFVSDNVASSCIRRLVSGEIMPTVITNAVAEWRKNQEEDVDFDLEQCCVDGTLASCNTRVATFCQDRTKVALPALLSADLMEKVELFFVQLSVDQSVDKVFEWIRANVTREYFVKCPTLLIAKKPIQVPKKSGKKTSTRLPPGGRKVEHLESAPAPSHSMRILRKCLRRLMSGDKTLIKNDIVSALDNVLLTLKHREDLIPCAETVFHRLLIELAQNIVFNRPDLMSDSLLDNFCVLWKTEELHLSKQDLSRLMCSRNLHLIKVSKQPDEAIWAAMGLFFLYMVTHSLLKADSLEEQFLNVVYSPSLPEKTVVLATECMAMVVKGYRAVKRNGGVKFLKVEDYLSWNK